MDRLQLRISVWFLNLAFRFAPPDREGKALRKAVSQYVPPWECHYETKGGFNVPLRDDCPHRRKVESI